MPSQKRFSALFFLFLFVRSCLPRTQPQQATPQTNTNTFLGPGSPFPSLGLSITHSSLSCRSPSSCLVCFGGVEVVVLLSRIPTLPLSFSLLPLLVSSPFARHNTRYECRHCATARSPRPTHSFPTPLFCCWLTAVTGCWMAAGYLLPHPPPPPPPPPSPFFSFLLAGFRWTTASSEAQMIWCQEKSSWMRTSSATASTTATMPTSSM